MKLVWNGTTGIAEVDGAVVTITSKPVDIEMEGLVAETTDDGIVATVVRNGNARPLGAAGIAKVQDYFDALAKLFTPVVTAYGVDDKGRFIGLVPIGSPNTVPTPPPERRGWRWDFDAAEWTEADPLEVLIAEALIRIDEAAGAARLRYITAVPGQEVTYFTKAQQAREWLANPELTPGAYLQAEADALELSIQDAATLVVTIADRWMNELGPAIERERRRGKAAVAAATRPKQVRTTLADTLRALAQI